MRSFSLVGLRLALPFVLQALLPGILGAQTVGDTERRLLPHQRDGLKMLPQAFWESLAFLRAEEDQQRALKADISFGLSGDEAGQKSLYKLNTGISLSRGDFPSELAVISRLGLQLRDGVLQEDVTSLQLTYDYHTTSALEYFTFAERFTDSFLSIQQRYEIGFGARLAAQIGRVGEGPTGAEHISRVHEAFAPMRATGGVVGMGNPAALSVADLDRFNAIAGNIERSIRDREARAVMGIAASVFAEIERADLDVVSVPATGPVGAADETKSKISLASVQRYRLSLRPTLRLRPSKEVSIRIYPYVKLPLDGPRRVAAANGRERLDYRRDIYSELAWSLKQDATGLENVEFVVTFNHYFDNVPPALTPSMVAAELAKGRVFRSIEAEGSHRLIALALRLRW